MRLLCACAFAPKEGDRVEGKRRRTSDHPSVSEGGGGGVGSPTGPWNSGAALGGAHERASCGVPSLGPEAELKLRD
jgi:hypothetical protein